jgi:hypothetical protein
VRKISQVKTFDADLPQLISHAHFTDPYDSDSESESESESALDDNLSTLIPRYQNNTTSANVANRPAHTSTTYNTLHPTTTATPSIPHYALFHTHDATPLTLPDVDSFHGNELQLPKPPNRTRFLTKNVHHVSTNNTDDELRMHFGDQHRLEIDFFGITEHKLDTHQYQVRQAFSASAHHAFQQHKIKLDNSELQTVSQHLQTRRHSHHCSRRCNRTNHFSG